MEFLGREKELHALDGAYRENTSSFVPVYGRRRVGKSALILNFLKRRQGLYYVGKQAPAALQIKEFLEVAARVLNEPLLAEMSPPGWARALQLVFERYRGGEKFVLALDEFQWLVAESPELPSVLQELWDRNWRSSGQLMLILCGSYIGFMEREVLGRKSPLFGRRTAQIQLKPFGYREARGFHKSYSLSDAARTYFVCGGVPHYLLAFPSSSSLEMNIQSQILNEFAPLFNEPDFLLREELRDLHNYFAILMALASGSLASPEVARRTGIPERSVAYYLNQLVELGYLRRRHPLTDGQPVARHIRFVLEDPLLRFWFRFVFPNRSSLAQLGPEKAFQDLVKPQLDAYFGACFEGMCRESMPSIYRESGVSASFEVGEYWDKQTQIDVVGLRADDWTDLGECKWANAPSLSRVALELDDRVRRYPNARNATIGRHLFVRSRATRAEIKGCTVHDLQTLYEGPASTYS